MPNIRLVVEYDGTRYAGWQYQLNAITVQAVLQQALSTLLQEPISLAASGRTDSGVHAIGQVVSFHTTSAMPMRKLRLGVNGLLPSDISVTDASEAPPGFDARINAKAKLYRYRILNRREKSALRAHRVWQVFASLDVERMRDASASLIGTHDFKSFQAAGSGVLTTTRTVNRIDIEEHPAEQEIWIEIHANGFLRQMVRSIVGSLVDVGAGKKPVEWVRAALEARDRTIAGRAAPPHGLYLVRVDY